MKILKIWKRAENSWSYSGEINYWEKQKFQVKVKISFKNYLEEVIRRLYYGIKYPPTQKTFWAILSVRNMFFSRIF